MRNATAAIALALAALSSATLAGCVPGAGGCGGYAGGGDHVLARGTDEMILCDNGGFNVQTAANGQIVGMYTIDAQDASITHGWLNDTTAVAFTLTEATDGTSSAPELGSGAWTEVTLDKVALDHANTLCVNLTADAWWTGEAPASVTGI